MLGRAGKAHDPPDQGVVAAVRAAGVAGEHLIQAVRVIAVRVGGRVDPEGTKPWAIGRPTLPTTSDGSLGAAGVHGCRRRSRPSSRVGCRRRGGGAAARPQHPTPSRPGIKGRASVLVQWRPEPPEGARG